MGRRRAQLGVQPADDQLGQPGRRRGDVAVARRGRQPPPRLRLVDVEAVERRDQAGAIGAEQRGELALQAREPLRGQIPEIGRGVDPRLQAVSHGSVRPRPVRRC